MNFIFVVDDNCADVKLISETLKEIAKGISLKFFYDSEKAINIFQE